MSETSLAERPKAKEPTEIEKVIQGQVNTAEELTARLRQIQDKAFICAPMTTSSAIAPSHVVNLVVIVVDPTVSSNGQGNHVYHSPSIHKKKKVGDEWVPTEVSLNKHILMKMLQARGVNVYPTQRLDDGRKQFRWVMQASGDVLDFDGSVVRLAPQTVEIDMMDGSPQIGGWTPAEWAKREREALAKLPDDQKWKAKPEPINGWTAARVLQARQFGYRIAESKALNALARNLGIKQSYTIEELKAKPFVFARPSYVPDTSNPKIAEMLAARALGARQLMYPSSEVGTDCALPPVVAHGDPGTIVETVMTPEPEVLKTGPLPDGDPVVVGPTATPTFHITKVVRAKDWVFAASTEGITFATRDADTATALAAASRSKTPQVIESEAIGIEGQTYRRVLNMLPGQEA